LETGAIVRRTTAAIYRCPYSGDEVELWADRSSGPEVLEGMLVSPQGRQYPIRDGVPRMIDPDCESFGAEETEQYDLYQAFSDSYDRGVDWLVRFFREDETALRNRVHDLLELKPDSRVLETGCGTCRDSIHLARRLGARGELFLQDLSANMLELGRRRMASDQARDRERCRVEFFEGNAGRLPFADGFFDAAYHFGGLNYFSDKKQALAEMTRVVRCGGKVVCGDEGLAPWLRGTPYATLLTKLGDHYLHFAPLDFLASCAQDVSVRWLAGNAYYVIDYRVGDGPPQPDLNLPMPG
jgi:ubiquinone/menaquinone biosynthesis C-methylase UbiE